MQTDLSSEGKRSLVGLILPLILLVVGYRVFVAWSGWGWNTAPLMAVAFGGGLLLGPRTWWLPVLILIVSDLAIGLLNGGGGFGGYTVASALLYAFVASLGRLSARGGHRWATLWCGTLLSSVLFYLAANTYSWMVLPGYEPSLAGWWQSQTTGLPQFSPPSWVFLRNSLIADSLWCGLAGLVVLGARGRATSPDKVANPV